MQFSEYDYGCVNDSEGISHSFVYTPYGDGSLDDFGGILMKTTENLSYNGKGMKRLVEEDGLRMIFRFAIYVDGRGGKLSMADTAIKQIGEGEAYTCAIAPDNGYQIYTVTLNGKDVTSLVNNGQLSVNYSELQDNNELEIKFVANGAVKRIKANNVIEPAMVVLNGETVTAVTQHISSFDHLQIVNDGLRPKTIGIIVVACVLAVCIATVVAVIVIFKKKRSA